MVQMIKDFTLLNPAGTLRLRFHKVGKLQYISHLDLVRTYTKALVRAGVPLWYSEGFNPTPRLAFATPMSVGLESLCEFVDVKIKHLVDAEEAVTAINAHLPKDMAVELAYTPTTKLAASVFSSYIINIETKEVNQEVVDAMNALFANPCVTVFKRTKKGEKETDIKPMIHSFVAKLDGGKISIETVLASGPSAFLNPEYLVTIMRERLGVLSGNIAEESYTICRVQTFFEDMQPFA